MSVPQSQKTLLLIGASRGLGYAIWGERFPGRAEQLVFSS